MFEHRRRQGIAATNSAIMTLLTQKRHGRRKSGD
jgi:hypothetical protein